MQTDIFCVWNIENSKPFLAIVLYSHDWIKYCIKEETSLALKQNLITFFQKTYCVKVDIFAG